MEQVYILFCSWLGPSSRFLACMCGYGGIGQELALLFPSILPGVVDGLLPIATDNQQLGGKLPPESWTILLLLRWQHHN